MKIRNLITALLLLVVVSTNAQTAYQWKNSSSGGYNYTFVTNDPTKSRFYTLKNGLKVILSQNNKEPRISFKMAVRAGSNTDPKSNTGLAHYLEHLLFKGTDKYGTLDYTKEKPLLDKIEDLYETYHNTKDPNKRKEIYAEIDKVSGEASNYSIANEYDKMMKSIGSQTTNAHTSTEETIYHEDLPSNAIDKFLSLQAERFRAPVFRIFHTELEAVYEEKNRGLDNDGNKSYEMMLSKLFPTHNYGQQTTIGTTEHLKNPSLVEIRKYYNKYYVPNNMALIMSGDINYDDLIKKIDQQFSYMQPKSLVLYAPKPEVPLTKIQIADIYGPSAENLLIAFRGYPENSRQSLLLVLISNILSNQKAGLMDININQQQTMLSSSANYSQMKDYGIFMISGAPNAGQTFEEAQSILLSQLSLLKKGAFDDNLIKATVANLKLSALQALESNEVRAQEIATAFIQNKGMSWDKMLSATNYMSKVTKKEIVDFANRFFVNNYVLVKKHKGEDRNIQKVDKPHITAVKTNTNEVSPYARKLIAQEVQPIAPKFLDFSRDLNFSKCGIADVISVQNTDNDIFRMNYRFEMGAYNYKLLPYAAEYLGFLGTDKLSAEEFRKAFYDIACSYSINVGTDVTTISITGLQQNFDKAVKLVEEILSNCNPNTKVLEDLKIRIFKSRENAKLNKNSILSGLTSYAQYGKDNPFNYGLSDDEIKNMKAEDLTGLLKKLTHYKHVITYYGPKTATEFTALLGKAHRLVNEFQPIAPAKVFTYIKTDSSKVYFADYDMVQAEIRWVRNAGLYNQENAAIISLFNSYFGTGMGSIVTQTIRESKALAYSTFATFSSPNTREKKYTFVSYVGAQADKMNDAISAMNELLSNLPESEKSFNLSKGSILNTLETSRITKDAIISAYFADRRLGFDNDSRIPEYNKMKTLTFDDIKGFHSGNLAGKAYSYCIVAAEKKINMSDLEKLGHVEKLTLKDIFNY